MELASILKALLAQFETELAILALIALGCFFSDTLGFPTKKPNNGDGPFGSSDGSAAENDGSGGGGDGGD